jgi:hypothetical protein
MGAEGEFPWLGVPDMRAMSLGCKRIGQAGVSLPGPDMVDQTTLSTDLRLTITSHACWEFQRVRWSAAIICTVWVING